VTVPWPGAGAKLPAIEFAERTHPGRDPSKQVNEDACGHRETPLGHLLVVCDGMGGHEGGREASNTGLQTIFEIFEKVTPNDPRGPGRVLREAIEEANRRVFALPVSEAAGAARPGATVVAVLHHPGGTEIAHAGDSRCYLLHGEGIVQLTKDHSMVQQMVDAHLLTPEQAAVHPDANRISRALGMKPEVEVELRPQPVAHVVGDVFVLCSDGLSDLVGPADILRIATGPAAQAVGQLVDLANARGGHDNITVQVLRARESAQVAPQALAPTVVDTSPPPPFGPPATVILPAAPVPVSHPPNSRPTPPVANTAIEDHATEPPAARRSPLVILGILLGIAGLAVAAFAVYISLDYGARRRHPVSVDALDATSNESPARAAVPASTSSTDAETAPLPSLIRTSRPRHDRDRDRDH